MTEFMNEKVKISVGQEGFVHVLSDSDGVMDSAFFPAGVPWAISRRLLLELVRTRKSRPSITVLNDTEEGGAWFIKICNEMDMADAAEKWEKDHPDDAFGVAEFLRANIELTRSGPKE